ncbi:MAG: electron transfer flavoprotein subunit beta/FixA family protein [Rikenellaceae bacterium]
MSKPLNIVVLAKQVPDTKNVGKDAMKADGTVNRGALETIFNPEDLNALEVALSIKERYPSKITILTMGPSKAADIIREGLFRGADDGVLLSDRKFAGSDTLATSYALSTTIKKMEYDLIIAGRQAIDGDTAQVGPQVAEKLDLPQITYCESVDSIENNEIIITRRLENGIEQVKGALPLVITVNASAPDCRPRNAKLVMKYKHAVTTTELQNMAEDYYADIREQRPYLNIKEWGADFIEAEAEHLGLSGSPTKVKKIENVVFTAKEAKQLNSTDSDIESLVQELIANHTIG